MTKQRRTVKLSRAKVPAAPSSAHSSVREPTPQPHVSVPDPVPRRSTYVEAVALYERGLTHSSATTIRMPSVYSKAS